MGKFIESSINRTGNTLAIAPRTAGAVVTTAADLFTTLKTVGKESAEIMADTSQKMKNTLINTWTEKTGNVKKAIKIAVSPIVTGVVGAEGIIRATVQPIYNGIINIKNTAVNTVKNVRRSTIGRVFSKKPISDFSFDNLSTRNLNIKNSTSSWWLSGNDSNSSNKNTNKSSSSRWKRSKTKSKDIKEKTKENPENQKTTEEIVTTPTTKEVSVNQKIETFDKDNKRGKENIKKKDEEIKLLKKEIKTEKEKNKKLEINQSKKIEKNKNNDTEIKMAA